MPSFVDSRICYFVPELDCKFPIDEDTLKADLDEARPDEVHSYRPFEYSVTCTNCLLAQILQNMRES